MRRNKDLASLFELQETALGGVATGIAATQQPIRDVDTSPVGPGVPVVVTPVVRTTLPGGGQSGDATAASFEYGDELEN